MDRDQHCPGRVQAGRAQAVRRRHPPAGAGPVHRPRPAGAVVRERGRPRPRPRVRRHRTPPARPLHRAGRPGGTGPGRGGHRPRRRRGGGAAPRPARRGDAGAAAAAHSARRGRDRGNGTRGAAAWAQLRRHRTPPAGPLHRPGRTGRPGRGAGPGGRRAGGPGAQRARPGPPDRAGSGGRPLQGYVAAADVDAVVVSHSHDDHWSDLVHLGYLRTLPSTYRPLTAKASPDSGPSRPSRTCRADP
ncbi:MAG: MBL fold metallo-hydrolase [Micromonosporaceae bacterium]